MSATDPARAVATCSLLGPWSRRSTPGGQHHATVADPDGHRVDRYAPLPG